MLKVCALRPLTTGKTLPQFGVTREYQPGFEGLPILNFSMARRLRQGRRFLSQALARRGGEADVEDPLIENSAELRVLSAEVSAKTRARRQITLHRRLKGALGEALTLQDSAEVQVLSAEFPPTERPNSRL